MSEKVDDEKTKKKNSQLENEKRIEKEKTHVMLMFIVGIPSTVILAVLVQYLYHNYYILPLKEKTLLPPLSLNLDMKSWRPNNPDLLFSLSTFSPNTLVFGIALFDVADEKSKNFDKIILTSTNETRSEWQKTDGITFGHQLLFVNDLQISVKWTNTRVGWKLNLSATGVQNSSRKQSILFYLAHVLKEKSSQSGNIISGFHKEHGNYTFSILTDQSQRKNSENQEAIKEYLRRKIIAAKDTSKASIDFMQFEITDDFVAEIRFENEDKDFSENDEFDDKYQHHSDQFDANFETAFNLAQSNMPTIYRDICKAALSRLLAARKFEHKTIDAQGYHNKRYQIGPLPLFSMELSDNNYGTIDDDMLAYLPVLKLDQNMIIVHLKSWLNIMNELDDIPSDYHLGIINVKQISTPYLFLLIEKLFNIEDLQTFEELYPRLNKVARATLLSLEGHVKSAFKSSQSSKFMLDYPRMLGKTSSHIDAHCMVVILARVMLKLSETYNISEDQDFYTQLLAQVDDFEKMREIYWNPKSESFVDISTSSVQSKSSSKNFSEEQGYGSLFPLMMHLIPHDSPILEAVITQISNEETLWSNYGIRSLSRLSPSYQQSSNSSQTSYKGDISIFANYLLLQSLKCYSEKSGAYQGVAHDLYSRLRNNLIGNVAREYRRTGVFWESYDDLTGAGKGGRNSIWAASILNIISEVY